MHVEEARLESYNREVKFLFLYCLSSLEPKLLAKAA